MTDEKSKLVYSTDNPTSRKEKSADNRVKSADQKSPGNRNVIVRLDRKGRGGKSVTVVEGLRMPGKDRETLLRQLKTALGTGGTLKDSALEIQGDRCDAIITALTKLGFSPKRSGG